MIKEKVVDTQIDTQSFPPEIGEMSYLTTKNGTYYLRVRVPFYVSEWFPVNQHGEVRTEYVRSLRTRDKAEAKELRDIWVGKLKEICRLLDDPDYPEESKRLKIQKLYEGMQNNTDTKPPARKITYLQDIIDKFVSSHKKNWKPRTLRDMQYSFWLATFVIGNKNIETLQSEDIEKYLETIMLLPPNIPKVAPDKKPAEIIKMKLDTMSSTTVRKHMQNLKSLLTAYSINIYNNKTIVLPKKLKANAGRKPYSIDDIQLLFNNLKHEKKHEERLWVCVIGFLHGFRQNEICQLTVADIVKHENYTCFHINEGEGQSIKNPDLIRYIPLHPKLIELRFLEYVNKIKKQKHKQLFPALIPYEEQYGFYLSKWFSRFGRKYIKDPKKVFHSFRHSFIDNLNNKLDVKTSVVSWLVGHENNENTTSHVYTKRPPMDIMFSVLSKNYHDEINWSKISVELAKTCL